MYQTLIVSSDGRSALDTRGRRLQIAGSALVIPGKMVWTDGRIIYGNIRMSGASPYIPVMADIILWLIPESQLFYLDTYLQKGLSLVAGCYADIMTCGDKGDAWFHVNGVWQNGYEAYTSECEKLTIRDACIMYDEGRPVVFDIGTTGGYYPKGMSTGVQKRKVGHSMHVMVGVTQKGGIATSFSSEVAYQSFFVKFNGNTTPSTNGRIVLSKNGKIVHDLDFGGMIAEFVNRKASEAIKNMDCKEDNDVQTVTKVMNAACHPDGSWQYDIFAASFHVVSFKLSVSTGIREAMYIEVMAGVISETRWIVSGSIFEKNDFQKNIVFETTRVKLIQGGVPIASNIFQYDNPSVDRLLVPYAGGCLQAVVVRMQKCIVGNYNEPVWVLLADRSLDTYSESREQSNDKHITDTSYQPEKKEMAFEPWSGFFDMDAVMGGFFAAEHGLSMVRLSAETDEKTLYSISGGFFTALVTEFGEKATKEILSCIKDEGVVKENVKQEFSWKLDNATAFYYHKNVFMTRIEGWELSGREYLLEAFRLRGNGWLFITFQINPLTDKRTVRLWHVSSSGGRIIDSFITGGQMGRNCRLRYIHSLKNVRTALSEMEGS